MQIDIVDWPVPLLADDDLRRVADFFEAFLPFQMIFGAFPGLGALQIVLFAVNEEYDVGILLD